MVLDKKSVHVTYTLSFESTKIIAIAGMRLNCVRKRCHNRPCSIPNSYSFETQETEPKRRFISLVKYLEYFTFFDFVYKRSINAPTYAVSL